MIDAQVEKRGGAPLSDEQLRFWTLQQLDPEGAPCNVFALLRLTGPLDPAIFQAALTWTWSRHEALRLQVVAHEGQPWQAVGPSSSLPLTLSAWSAEAGQAPETGLKDLASRYARVHLDPAAGDVLRAHLVRLEADDHALILVIHHIAGDFASIPILMDELALAYRALAAGDRPERAAPMQLPAYARRQREGLTAEREAALRTYWDNQLAGPLSVPDLPLDDQVAATSCSQELPVAFSAPEAAAIADLAWETGTTTHAVVLTAFLAVLGALSGEDELTVALPVALREPADAGLVGCAINLVLLRADLAAAPTFRGLLRHVASAARGAYAHKDLPLGRLMPALRVAEHQRGKALARTVFNCIPAPAPIEAGGLQIAFVFAGLSEAQADLHLMLAERPDGLSGWLLCPANVAPHAAPERLVAGMKRFLEAASADPDGAINPSLAELSADRLDLVVASTFTAEPLREPLVHWLKTLGLWARVRFAPFNQVFQEILSPESLVRRNVAGVNLLAVRLSDWCEGPRGADPALVDEFVAALAAAPGTHVLLIAPQGPGAPAEVLGLAARLAHEAAAAGAHVLEAEAIFARYPVAPVLDPARDAIGRIPYTDAAFVAMATAVARLLDALRRPPIKVAALDCDGTLWGGVVGEDGPEGLVVDPPRRALQAFMKAQQEAGLVLCLVSKNEPEDVEAAFAAHPDMPLRPAHVLARRIGWGSKAQALRELAEELGLGLDAFVFVDDSPVECLEVREALPQVVTLQLPSDPGDLPAYLDHAWIFDRVIGAGREDARRTTLYREDASREQLRREAASPQDFWASLGLEVAVYEAPPEALGRVAQLVARTNQFNASTVRRSESEIRATLAAGSFLALVAEAKDRFGDYGQVGVAFATRAPGEAALVIDTLLLSCRAMGRGVEHRMVAALGERASAAGLADLVFLYKPSGRNRPALNFLRSLEAHETELPGGQGLRFSLPAAAAAACAFDPQRLRQLHQPEVDPATGVAPIGRAGAARYHAIAAAGGSVEAIAATFAARPSPGARTGAPSRAPASSREAELVAIWAAALAMENLGPDDDFFRLGGTSLAAVGLLARLRVFARGALGYEDLIAAPTPAAMAHRLTATRSPGRSAPALEADARLSPDIRPIGEARALAQTSRIFLTGATGFLGAHLLRGLLDRTAAAVYCLVRARDEAEGHARLVANMAAHGLWKAAFTERIVPVPGDLEAPAFGLAPAAWSALADEMEALVHNGAKVNFLLPYAALAPANVGGTRTMLALASSGRPKALHYVSTLAIFESPHYTGRVADESDTLAWAEGITGGYAQSKWVADRLVGEALRRGLPGSIHRPGVIGGDRQHGRGNADDLLLRFVISAFTLGLIPDLGIPVPLMPVDFLAEAIVTLAAQEPFGGVYHYDQRDPIAWVDFVRWLDDRAGGVRAVPFERWLAAVEEAGEANAMFTLAADLHARWGAGALLRTFGRDRLEAALARAGLVVPPTDAALLDRYLADIRTRGFLPSPSASS